MSSMLSSKMALKYFVKRALKESNAMSVANGISKH